jgi:hypothetical protein
VHLKCLDLTCHIEADLSGCLFPVTSLFVLVKSVHCHGCPAASSTSFQDEIEHIPKRAVTPASKVKQQHALSFMALLRATATVCNGAAVEELLMYQYTIFY